MKKIKPLIFVVGIFAVVGIFFLVGKAYGNRAAKNSEPSKEEASSADQVAYVDQKMDEVLTSEEYNEMSSAERSERASEILSQLEKEGYITGVSYDEDSLLYSFEYSDGTLGGWQIEDFSGKDGLLPMN